MSSLQVCRDSEHNWLYHEIREFSQLQEAKAAQHNTTVYTGLMEVERELGSRKQMEEELGNRRLLEEGEELGSRRLLEEGEQLGSRRLLEVEEELGSRRLLEEGEERSWTGELGNRGRRDQHWAHL